MTRLTHGAGYDIEPVWSPDGSRIAYVNSPRFGSGELQIVTADGKNVPLKKRVEVLGTVLYQKLEWLADDRLIGVLRVDGQALGFGSIHLGTGETKSFSPAPTWGRFAASPDGQWLAYTTTLDQPGQQSGNDDQRMAKLDGPVRLDKSGWLSLRASGPGHADHPVGSLDAHTSPIYVQLTGSPSGTREDAAYFLKWIDRLSLALRLRDRVPNDAMRQHIQTQLESARAVYSKIVESGQ